MTKSQKSDLPMHAQKLRKGNTHSNDVVNSEVGRANNPGDWTTINNEVLEYLRPPPQPPTAGVPPPRQRRTRLRTSLGVKEERTRTPRRPGRPGPRGLWPTPAAAAAADSAAAGLLPAQRLGRWRCWRRTGLTRWWTRKGLQAVSLDFSSGLLGQFALIHFSRLFRLFDRFPIM